VSADDEPVTFRYRVNGSADAAGTDSATQQQQECTLGAADGARQRGEGAAPGEREG
jgi:hypothetical protein